MLTKARFRAEVSPQSNPDEKVRGLAVGETDEWRSEHAGIVQGGLSFVAFHEVTDHLLELLKPPIVYSPVLAKSFDCIELALLLHQLGFRGQYRAVATDLPNPQMVENEVRQSCPNFDFKIVLTN